MSNASQLLDKVGLTSRAHQKPGELTGGERQRTAVARALVGQPDCILADEPTGNLDSKTGVEIMAVFERLHQKGHTIILITHEVDIAKHAHRVIHILDGTVERDEMNHPRTTHKAD